MLAGKGGCTYSRKSLLGKKRSRSSLVPNDRAIRRKTDEGDLFEVYSDKKKEVITGTNLIKFYLDAEIVDDYLAILALSWKWNCERGGRITKKEFSYGMEIFGCTSMSEFRQAFKDLLLQLRSRLETFRDFYNFVFDFTRRHQVTNKKTISICVARALLNILLKERFPFHLHFFSLYLNQLEKDTRVRLTNDQWTSYLAFCLSVDGQTLAGYEEDGAWPVLLDTYIEWYRENYLRPLSFNNLSLDSSEQQQQQQKRSLLHPNYQPFSMTQFLTSLSDSTTTTISSSSSISTSSISDNTEIQTTSMTTMTPASTTSSIEQNSNYRLLVEILPPLLRVAPFSSTSFSSSPSFSSSRESPMDTNFSGSNNNLRLSSCSSSTSSTPRFNDTKHNYRPKMKLKTTTFPHSTSTTTTTSSPWIRGDPFSISSSPSSYSPSALFSGNLQLSGACEAAFGGGRDEQGAESGCSSLLFRSRNSTMNRSGAAATLAGGVGGHRRAPVGVSNSPRKRGYEDVEHSTTTECINRNTSSSSRTSSSGSGSRLGGGGRGGSGAIQDFTFGSNREFAFPIAADETVSMSDLE